MPASAAPALIAQTIVGKPAVVTTASIAPGAEQSESGETTNTFSGMVTLVIAKQPSVESEQYTGTDGQKSLKPTISDALSLETDPAGLELASSLVLTQPQQPVKTANGTTLLSSGDPTAQGDVSVPEPNSISPSPGKNGIPLAAEQGIPQKLPAPFTQQMESSSSVSGNNAATLNPGDGASTASTNPTTQLKNGVASPAVTSALEQSKELPVIAADTRTAPTTLSGQPIASARGLASAPAELASGGNGNANSGSEGKSSAFAKASKLGSNGQITPSTSQATSPDTGGNLFRLEVTAPAPGQFVAEASRPAEQTLQTVSRGNTPLTSVAEQVAVQIEKATQSGTQRISIQLDPAELGRIEVKLEFAANGRLSANIVVEKTETLDSLQRDLRGLERTLQQAGVTSDGDKLDYNLRGPDQNSRQGQAATGMGAGPESGSGRDSNAKGDDNPKFEGANSSKTLAETDLGTMLLKTEIRLKASPGLVDIQV